MKAFGLTLIVLGLASAGSDEAEPRGLLFCDPERAERELVVVSTLDGMLSVLDSEGQLRWSMQTEPGPLLASSIDRLELTNSGRWVRMIPSLSGGFYKFDGENIEAIPVTASSLLHSSNFLSTDGLVVSGGQESRTYGLALDSGAMRFSCAMSGCDNASSAAAGADLLLVHRRSHTVRAVEVRSGLERWNFSVGQLELQIVSEQCGSEPAPGAVPSAMRVSAVVPEGLVRVEAPGAKPWTHKLAAPIVSAWRVRGGAVTSVELFAGADGGEAGLYVGMHRKQLYVQESPALAALARRRQALPNAPALALPWRPVAARARKEMSAGSEEVAVTTAAEDDTKETALSVLYASEYANGEGFYLYHHTTCGANHSGSDLLDHETHIWPLEDDEDETPSEIIMGSLWLWWREVAVISLATAAVVHLLLGRAPAPVAAPLPAPPPPPAPVLEPAPAPANSRYEEDFEQVAVLGRGGFGVVFEAMNRVDARRYAVKRVPLRPGQRESVLREVRALASLEHPHIVRYFNAWLEGPRHSPHKTRGDAVIDISSESGCSSGDGTAQGDSDSRWPERSHPTDSDFVQFREPSITNGSDFIQFREPSMTNGSDFIQFREPSMTNGSDFIQFRETSNTNDSDASQLRKPSKVLASEASAVDSIVSNDCSSRLSVTSCDDRASSTGHTEVEASADPGPESGSRVPRGTVYLFIQMQLCRKDSLRDWLRENDERTGAVPMFVQILEAVEYVHAQALIHRDLKPSNIFFAPDGRVKVGDFGLVTAAGVGAGDSANSGRKHTGGAGTQLYMSPEQRAGLPYSYKVDIFSLGIILFELLVPFGTEMERGVAIGDARAGRFCAKFSAAHGDAVALLRQMLAQRPDARPSAAEIRRRPPFAQL